jgi:hypothetical protein
VRESTTVSDKIGVLGGGGGPGRKHILEQSEISTNEVIVLFDLTKLVYEIKSLS